MIWNFIRHGKTIANEKHLYCGNTDLSLSDEGINELNLLKTHVEYPKADLYITSGMKRTNQTLKVLYGENEFITIENLKEMNFGKFEMKSYQELKKDSDYIRWISDIQNEICVDGEGEKQFKQRIYEGIEELNKISTEYSCNNAVVITHGGVISAVMEYYFPMRKNFLEWQPCIGRGYSLEFSADKTAYKII